MRTDYNQGQQFICVHCKYLDYERSIFCFGKHYIFDNYSRNINKEIQQILGNKLLRQKKCKIPNTNVYLLQKNDLYMFCKDLLIFSSSLKVAAYSVHNYKSLIISRR